jgi:HEPN domain-containing protein
MNPVTREWVAKAEGDFVSAGRELRARKSPNFDAACFHSQQCAEKYLKAVLHHAGEAFPRTHDLIALLERVLKVSAVVWVASCLILAVLEAHLGGGAFTGG